MKKVGSIYSKGNNKENTLFSLDIPTRRKESIDMKSNHTQSSYHVTSQYVLKSSSMDSPSQILSEYGDQMEPDTLRDNHTFGDISVEQSCFDSLDIYTHN